MFIASSGLIIPVELFATSEAILLIFSAVIFIKSVMVFVVVVYSRPKTRDISNIEKQISLYLLIHTMISYFSTRF
jgi:hypothetical protein